MGGINWEFYPTNINLLSQPCYDPHANQRLSNISNRASKAVFTVSRPKRPPFCRNLAISKLLQPLPDSQHASALLRGLKIPVLL